MEGAKKIYIFNCKDKFYANAENTARKIENKVPGVTVEVYPLEDSQKLYEKIKESDILVNATKSGMKPAEDESLIKDVSVFRTDFVVADAGGKSSRLQNCTGRNWYASMAGRSCFPDFYRREHAYGGSV